ncbi:MAG: hypothetical protein H0T86_15960 [Gemmatimonadales bacterium]|nr:hypothetical protein [Gemmatimonadales bacterium]
MTRPGIRQALLKPAFSHLYPGIPANEWQPAAVLMDQVLALRLRKQEKVPVTRDRALTDAHFEFRGVASSGSNDAERQARQDERRRRQSAE